ncbi:MAG: hypothetical protein ACR2N5_03855 [Solirubrobacterales bacterium]
MATAAGAALLVFPASAAADKIVGVDLGVTGASAPERGSAEGAGLAGEPVVLAQHRQYTGTTRMKASKGASCFGAGTGGSGEKVTVDGPTALGALRDGGRADADLRPLSVTDAFSFGLGLCGIGGIEAPQTGFWYLKHNHAGAQVGGDLLKLKNGDDVLWHLIPDFSQPLPAELEIQFSQRKTPGVYNVTVNEYADDGTKTPAPGATVTASGSAAASAAATAVTGPDGKASFALSKGTLKLTATRGGDIPAVKSHICIGGSECGKFGKKVFGTNSAEKLKGTGKDDVIKPLAGADKVKARGGDDVVNVRGGGRDVVDCGAGKDLVKAGNNDRTKKNCEKVKVR